MSIANLPDRTPTCAANLISGIGTANMYIDLSRLTLFGQISRAGNNPIWETARRQLTMKNKKSKSWFIQLRATMEKYGMDDPIVFLLNPPDIV